ncbi:MAG TPA: MFS transporter [Dehalococcoidia bacterium]
MQADGGYKWKALGTVSVGAFMATLDASVVNIAFPTLARVFHTTPDTVLWVTLAYILVSTGLTLTLGRVGDLLGRKRIYAWGFVIFTLGLALSAAAQSLPQLVAARVVQAVGGAMTVSNGTAIVTDAFPASQRGQAIGIIGSVVGAGLAAGPALGGLILTALDWRAIFYTQLPVGILGSVVAFRVLRADRGAHGPRSVDLLGAGALFVTLASLILAVNRGQAWGWRSPTILGLLALAAAGAAAVLWVEGRLVASPILDLNLFRSRLFSGAVASLVMSFLATAGLTFLMPFYLTEVLGYPAARTGLVLTTVPLTMLLVAPISGSLSDTWGPRYLATLGLALTAAGLLSFQTAGAGTGTVGVVARLLLVGLGAGLFQSPNNSSIMGAAPRDRLGTASAMIATSRSTGQAVGLALAGALFTYSAVRAAGGGTAGPEGLDAPAVLTGIHAALLASALIAAAAIPVSLLRGRPLEEAAAQEAGRAESRAGR